MRSFTTWLFTLLLCFMVFSPMLYAQSPAPAPGGDVIAAANSAEAAPILDVQTAIADASLALKSIGGLAGAGKVMCGLLLFLALCKVSADGKIPLISQLWPKSDDLKPYVAPFLALAIGLLSLYMSGGSLTLAGALAFLAVGKGASALHDLLDLVKKIPGLGAIYVTIINVIEGALGGAKPVA